MKSPNPIALALTLSLMSLPAFPCDTVGIINASVDAKNGTIASVIADFFGIEGAAAHGSSVKDCDGVYVVTDAWCKNPPTTWSTTNEEEARRWLSEAKKDTSC